MLTLLCCYPEIAPNVGTLIRLCACWKLPLVVVEPCGFLWNDKALHRAAMDYETKTSLTRYPSWKAYVSQAPNARRVALAPRRGTCYTDFSFQPNDHLILGSESCGLPQDILEKADECVFIPLAEETRSLNMAIAGAVVAAEALRQLTKGTWFTRNA